MRGATAVVLIVAPVAPVGATVGVAVGATVGGAVGSTVGIAVVGATVGYDGVHESVVSIKG
jgi:hypothetical protein